VVRRHPAGWDEKSAQKIAQMLALDLPEEIAAPSARKPSRRPPVETGCGGITYPSGGWLCPQQLTAELLRWRQLGACAPDIRLRSQRWLLTMTAGSSMSSCVMRWWCWQTAII
jgi:hypothetical protein